MNILLASASPRRKFLLEQLGHQVTVISPDFDESAIAEQDPQALVCALAQGKGRSISAEPQTLLVAADTVVCYQGRILGKPSSPEDAAQTLRTLSGNTHEVYTGVYLRKGEKELVFAERALVHFRPLSEQEINAYVQSGGPMDKAGAYGIQETDFVCSISGSFHNIMGFPTEKFTRVIQDF